MSRKAWIPLFCLLVFSSIAFAADSRQLTFDSFGAARIGMSREQLAEALGGKLEDAMPGDDDSEQCGYVTSARVPKGVSFMLIDQHLARIDIISPQILAASGIRIGSTQADVLAAYPGRVQVSPHAYTSPEGTYLTIHSLDGHLGIRFETDQGRVVNFYAGTAQAIEYIEGCL